MVTVHSGQTCLLWDDLWIGQVRKQESPELYLFKSISVKKAHHNTDITDLFSLPLSVEAFNQFQILQLEFSALVLNDEINNSWTYIWGSTLCSSSKTYRALTGHSQVEPIFIWLWKTSCQGKHKIFFWLILKDKWSTRDMIKRRGMNLDDSQCVLCQQSVYETVMHLIFYCPFAKECWNIANFRFADFLSVWEIFLTWKLLLKEKFSLDLFILFCWCIWMVRNDVIFTNKNPTVEDCKRYIVSETFYCFTEQKRV
jgi:hypothetical protein